MTPNVTINVTKRFNLRLPDYDAAYPNPPSVMLFNGAGVKEKVIPFEPGEQSVGAYHEPIIWDASKFIPGALKEIALELDHPLDSELGAIDELKPSDRTALLTHRALAFGNLGIFIGWRTRSIAEHPWVKQHIGAPKSSAELDAEAAEMEAKLAAKRAAAAERRKVEADVPESQRALAAALAATPDLLKPLTDPQALPQATQLTASGLAVDPNTRAPAGQSAAPNTRTGVHSPNAI